MKYLRILLALLFIVACEPTVDNPDTPTPPNTEDDGKEDGKDNGKDDGDDDSWMDEVIDTSGADYPYVHQHRYM